MKKIDFSASTWASFDASFIPGMIEPVEQSLLFNVCASLDLAPGDQLVEFGSFFGRSTYCIGEGLRANPAQNSTHCVHAYDSFACSASGGFISHVKAFAASGGVEALINYGYSGRVSFLPIFEHYLRSHRDSGSLIIHPEEIISSKPANSSRIAFMHIDSPKFYEEFRYVLFRFFPRLRVGSVVVFQDFLYPWSASLIAAVERLRMEGIIQYNRTAASAIATTVLRQPDLDELVELDLSISPENIEWLVASAVEEMRSIPVDRENQFVPRLMLARVQHIWSTVGSQAAVAEMVRYLNTGIRFDLSVASDFFELMGNDFDIRKVYSRDHRLDGAA